jgi:glycosyltransferase involved in cell wall biosynthesis
MTHDVGVSVVVPAYNAEETVGACLRALLAQDAGEPYEVILVDDGSSDRTAEVAGGFGPRVRVVRQANRGAAAARNTGVAAARGEIVLFTDADCEPAPGWAWALIRAIRSGADGAKGTYRTRQRALAARFVQAEYESKYRRMARMRRIDFVDTYSAAYRRDLFVRSGGFDEGIRNVEDQELSFRLAEAGANLRFAPGAVVYHRHAATLRAYARKKYLIGYWKVAVLARHPGRAVTDSHTPQSQKAQMALFALAGGSLALSVVSGRMRRAAGAVGLASAAAFVASTLPFAARLASRDPALAVVTPVMMLVRAAALSAGMAAGLARFGPRRSEGRA